MMASYNHAQPLTIGKNKNIPHNIDKSSTLFQCIYLNFLPVNPNNHFSSQ